MEIIIMGHGHFASGLYSTLELIGGEQENVACRGGNEISRRMSEGEADDNRLHRPRGD